MHSPVPLNMSDHQPVSLSICVKHTSHVIHHMWFSVRQNQEKYLLLKPHQTASRYQKKIWRNALNSSRSTRPWTLHTWWVNTLSIQWVIWFLVGLILSLDFQWLRYSWKSFKIHYPSTCQILQEKSAIFQQLQRNQHHTCIYQALGIHHSTHVPRNSRESSTSAQI